MRVIRTSILSALLFFAGIDAFCQELPQAEQLLEAYCKRNTPVGYSPRLNQLILMPKGNLHYLFPLYHALRDPIKFKMVYTDKGYYDELSQFFSFVGDYQSAQYFLVKSYDSITDGTRRKVFQLIRKLDDQGLQQIDARKYIHFVAANSQVIMINEAYAKPQHRAFTLSILADLYRQGFRYLAMEMLNNFSTHTLDTLTIHTGYYSAEPIAGELIRAANAIGYKLISYEDTLADVHTPGLRDTIQAQNLYQVLREDPSAKILVHASYTHISKKQGPDGSIPMGMIFKNISGIDPVTIDQTDMTEESDFGYGRVMYQAYTAEHPVKVPTVALLNNAPLNITNNDLYDFSIIHPPTQYVDGRPSWLSLGGLRKPVYVKPATPAAFLVQAYYKDEIVHNNNKPFQLVPADQTYIPSSKKSFLLYLQKGKYVIYFRDIDYHALKTLEIEVD